MSATIAFIGAGNMAGSLIGGLKQNGYAGKVLASDLDQAKLQQLNQQFGTGIAADNNDAVAQADVVVLAVKPQIMKVVCEAMRDAVQQKKPMIVSIAAGLTSDTIENWLGGDLPMVRCMPNTPALVQMGASGLYANDTVSEQQRALAESLFNAVGVSVWVDDENQLHAVTATSGSGPAYFFLFMEAMQKSAESLGLSPDVARSLVAQTARGAAEMVCQSELSTEQLRLNVTSPNGTTEQAIHSFEQDGLRQAVQQAMIACEKRSKELAEELAD
jgi:pyrroline-5-carboxylate reductase